MRSLVFLTLAVLLTAGVSRADESPIQFLREATNASQTLSFEGEVQSLRFGAQNSEAAIYRVEHRAPNLTRRWYLAPQDLYGDSTISRGPITYAIDVKRDRVVVSTENPSDGNIPLRQNFGLITQNYHVSFAPDETLVDRRVRVVALINKYTGQTTMRVWIDANSKLILQKQFFSPSGALLSQIRFEHLRYTNDIPLAVFAIPKTYARVNGTNRASPSADIQRVVQNAGFAAREPRYLPEGFIPVNGNVVEIKGVRTLHLLYSDGIRTISLFQNARGAAVDLSAYKVKDSVLDGRQVNYVEDGPTTLLAWSENGLHFALVGEVNRTELERIAGSVIP